MSYSISEIWEMMNSENKKIREQGDELFEKWKVKDDNNMALIRPYFPKEFWDLFEDEKYFHDYLIDSIKVQNLKKHKVKININISKKNKKYILIFQSIISYSFNIESTETFFDKIGIGYFEIYRKDNFWNIIITCDEKNIIKVICEEFQIKSA